MMGIQFAKMSGCFVVTTCSPKNFALLTSLGADYCVDYNSETCIEDIKNSLAGTPLKHAWDCIATVKTARVCAESMSPRGGRYSSLLLVSNAIPRRVNPRIRSSTTIGYTVFGEEFRKETVVPRREEDFRFWLDFWKMSEILLRQQMFKPPPLFVNVGGKGFEGILHGIQHLKQGEVSAGKLVYNLPSISGFTGNAGQGDISESVTRHGRDSEHHGNARGNARGQDAEKSEEISQLFTESEVISAFSDTKRLTDDIVARNGFSGYFAEAHPEQERLCVSLIVQGLLKLQYDLKNASAGQILERMTAVPGAQKQLDYCYRLLSETGLIHLDGCRVVRTEKPLPTQRPEHLLSQLVQNYPAFASVSRLIQHTGDSFADIWTGRTDGIRVIFGTSVGKQLAEDVYGLDKTSLAFHGLLKDFLSRLLNQKPVSCLRLLEIGAGTGGTTQWLAPLLGDFQSRASARVVYTFTDLAHALVSKAARNFQRFPFMKFQMYDMETAAPDVLAGTQDVVLAVNAVHATSDIVQSLRNLRGFLRPGGIALVLEIQERVCWADFIFGFFEGWWRFNDGRTHATASPQAWRDAFQKAGFEAVDWTDGTTKDSRFQRLFLGRN